VTSSHKIAIIYEASLGEFNPLEIKILFLVLCIIAASALTAQVTISTDSTTPDGSAMLDVQSTDKGFLPPRMTQAQIEAIATPANGLTVFNTTDNKLYIFAETDNQWKEVEYGTGTITPPWSCGNPLAITHTIGDVAPETKTVSYGTVTSSLSGAGKCWITQNLGADQQATSATDATDASAGWYWQFNRKQGYMAGPTPAWTITSIDEDSDWLPAQDPCTIELGAGWRLPTNAEWTNTDANGTWTNYNDAYASVLKLHCSGMMDIIGTLSQRGFWGMYWTSSEHNATDGFFLFFANNTAYTANETKAEGMGIRCIKD